MVAGCRSLKGRTAQLVSSQERSERRRERRGQLAVREDGMATAAARQRSQNSQYGQKVHQSHFTSLRSAPRCCTRCPTTPPTRLTSSDLPPSLDHHFSCHSAVAHAKWSFCCFSSSHTSPLQVIRTCTRLSFPVFTTTHRSMASASNVNDPAIAWNGFQYLQGQPVNLDDVKRNNNILVLEQWAT